MIDTDAFTASTVLNKSPDDEPRYGTPNCSFIGQVLVVNASETVELTSDYSFTSEVNVIDQNSISATLYFSVSPNTKNVPISINKLITLSFAFDCQAPPLLYILNAANAPYFYDRRISLQTVATLFLNYSLPYDNIKCETLGESSYCFNCSISPTPNIKYSYNIFVDPIYNTTCNYSTPISIQLKDNFNSNTVNFQLNTANTYSKLKSTNFKSQMRYPNTTVITATYNSNNIEPLVSSVFEIESSINELYSLVVENSLPISYGLPTFIGFSQTKLSGNYLCQKSIQSNVSFDQKLFNMKDNLVLLDNYQISRDVNYTIIIDGNIYSRSDFTLGQSDSFKIKYNDQLIQFKFPFGFGKGTLKQYNHIFNNPFSVYTPSMTVLPNYQAQPINSQTFSNPIPQVDKTAPFLISCNITALSYYSFRYTIQAGDIESGIYSITILEDYDPRGEGTVILYQSNIIGGNIWNGTFSVDMNVDGYNHDSSFSIVIESRSGLKSIFKSETFIPYTSVYIDKFPKRVSWGLQDVLAISTTYTDSDPLFNYTSILSLKLMNPDANLVPRIQIDALPPHLSKKSIIISGTFNSGSNLYDFSVPHIPYSSSFGDNINYVLLGDTDMPSKISLHSFANYYLNVEAKSDIIMIPPTLKSVVPLSGGQFNFTFQCFGQVNCENTIITIGYVVIQGEYDPVPKKFSFTQISNSYISPPLNITTTSCRSQTYTVISAYLSDGYRESDSDDPNTISPFLYVNQTDLSFISVCSTPNPDIILPKLNSFTLSPPAINASVSNFIIVKISVSDDQRIKYFPTLYLTSLLGNIRVVDPPTPTCNVDNNVCTVIYFLTLPSYWGAGNISVSLYGLTDEYDNFNGYSTYDLSKFNQSIIHRKYDSEPPAPTPSIKPLTPTLSPPILICTKKCSNNGVCILNNQCKCNPGFFGPNCEGRSYPIPKPLPDPEEPRVISDPNSDINLDISIEELVEIDSLEVVNNRYSLLNKKWTLMTSNNNNTYKYSLAINNETNLYIQIDWSDQERIIQFAGLNITIAPHSLKYTISLDHYSFKSNLNYLQLRMSTNFSSNDEKCSSSIETSGDNNDLEWIKLQYNGKILYGRFVQIALVDGQPQKASTKLIESEEEGGSSYFGINIPFYINDVTLDPDFSVLVTDQYDKCKDPLLSTGAIIGIAVGGAVFVVLLIATIVIMSNRTRRIKMAYTLKSKFKIKSTQLNIINIDQGLGKYVVLDTSSQYGTPNCDLRVSLNIFGNSSITKFIHKTNNVPFSYDYYYLNASSLNLVAVIKFTVDPTIQNILYSLDNIDIFNISTVNYCIQQPADINLTYSANPITFSNRLVSLQLQTIVFVNGLAYSAPYTCKALYVGGPNNCFQCNMYATYPFTGYYNLTIDPILTTAGCDYSAQLNVTLTRTNGESSAMQLANPIGSLVPPTTPSQQSYPTDSVLTFKYGYPKPTLSTVLSLPGQPNLLYNIYASSTPSSYNEGKELKFSFLTFDISAEINIILQVNTLQAIFFNGNAFVRSNFTLSQSKSFGITYGSRNIEFPFPFGYGEGNLKQYNHVFDYPISIYQSGINVQATYQNQNIPPYNYTNQNVSGKNSLIISFSNYILIFYENFIDTTPPFLVSINIRPLSLYSYEYIIVAGDNESGVYTIRIYEDNDPSQFGYVIFSISDLVNGTTWSGTYKKNIATIGYNHDKSFSIVIEDRAGQISTYRSGQFIPYYNFFIQPFPKQVSWNANNITSFGFASQEVDISGGKVVQNKLSMKVTNPIQNMYVFIEVYSMSPTIPNMRRIGGAIDMNSGTISILFSTPYNISTNGENLYFILKGDQDIHSAYLMNKFIQKCIINSTDSLVMPPVFKDIQLTATQTGINIKADIFCFGQDGCGNAIIGGTMYIQGEYDPIVYPLSFPNTNATTLFFDLPLKQAYCRNQTYSVVYAFIHTDAGLRVSDSSNPNYINPFMYIIQDKLSLEYECTTPTPDTTPPILESFFMYPTTLLANETTTVYFNLTISDDRGFKNFPYIYTAIDKLPGLTRVDQSSYNCTFIKVPTNKTVCALSYQTKFSAKDSFPMGNISVSLYGLLDEYDNFNGYSTYDLSKFNISTLYVLYPNQPVPLPTTTPKPTQTPTFTPSVTPIPCSNKCSDNGVCILNNQCKCNPGFFGPNCEGKPVLMPKPVPNPDEPNVVSNPNSDVNLEISIEELVEIDSLDVEYSRYSLSNKKWSMMSSNNNNTNKYSLAINNETNLYIQIDWSDQERIIQFAGLNITIAPHSLKYTISLDHYSFKSNLNYLQLRMSTKFNATDEKCSSSIETSGNNNDLEWIKLQYNGKILYGRFVQIALVDGQPQKASTKLIESEEEGGISYLGINIPFYSNDVILDPDFSVLLSNDPVECKEKPTLSTGAIIGIAVGGAAVVAIVFLAVILSSRTRRMKIMYNLRSMTSRKESSNVQLK
ncbi:hypothetical protein PPL_06872 [Heterostelium album PN500]|uniref:EGF-like domain-containing protein n=1 Tax=Heterostelium pallidum (strain ATCC 26659 / Pp 5 / PN500) TaxID=670386 RepID=D3BDS0_HETP5|nr:hypothetical protein PPL_06872 [Heterostelium album PN500]EFA80051.1 hypothetical protein PPL_06872 [Heterostelium album PN500]|eukprot:XP_020432171.1 hypothetical protein PPL_06872 [Heterostelium album PN500]